MLSLHDFIYYLRRNGCWNVKVALLEGCQIRQIDCVCLCVWEPFFLPSFIHPSIQFISFLLCFDHKISTRLHAARQPDRQPGPFHSTHTHKPKSSFHSTFFFLKCARNVLTTNWISANFKNTLLSVLSFGMFFFLINRLFPFPRHFESFSNFANMLDSVHFCTTALLHWPLKRLHCKAILARCQICSILCGPWSGHRLIESRLAFTFVE